MDGWTHAWMHESLKLAVVKEKKKEREREERENEMHII